MKTLLCGINAKYIHTNLAIRLIKGYVEENTNYTISIIEFTINNYTNDILKEIYIKKPDILGFSCYIWNIEIISKLTVLIKKVLPKTLIILGGPEVSYNPIERMQEIKCDFVIAGEGEVPFSELMKALHNGNNYGEVPSLYYRDNDKILISNKNKALQMGVIPFPYKDFNGLKNKICYYEASRGCPFGCKYCLSSIEKGVRYAPIEKVKRELDIFIEMKVLQVKFVDRTFNSNKKFAMQIIQHLIKNDNGITNFHFEVEAILLDDEIIALLSSARKGLFQLEIGVQTTNEKTLLAVNRRNDYKWLSFCVKKLKDAENIHLHLDLIAGLPLEDYESFVSSFNAVNELLPHQLQLGFLKILKGSDMEQMCKEYKIEYSPYPPYEVLSTGCLSYTEIITLKGVEDIVEVYYNTNRFHNSIKYLRNYFDNWFALYHKIYEYKTEKGVDSLVHNKQLAYTFLLEFAKNSIENFPDDDFKHILKLDFLLHEKPRSSPEWAFENELSKNDIYDLVVKQNNISQLLPGYDIQDKKALIKIIHVEKFKVNPLNSENKPAILLFDYRCRDLWGNASAILLE